MVWGDVERGRGAGRRALLGPSEVDARRRVGVQTGAQRSSSCAASGGWGSPVTTPLGDTPKGVCEQA